MILGVPLPVCAAGVALALLACAPSQDAAETPGVSSAVSTCAGEAVVIRHHLQFVNLIVRQSFCQPYSSALQVTTVDDTTGSPVDLEALLAADTAAFHNWHASLAPGLRTVAETNPNKLHEAYVWFRIDESGAAAKDVLLGDAVAASEATALQDAALRKVAGILAARIASLSNVESLTEVDSPQIYGIPVIRLRAPLAELETIGSWPEVWRVDLAPGQGELYSDNYYYTTGESVLDYFGYDGTGVTVAIYEWDRPDRWENLPGVPSGSCYTLGGSKKCHCASGGTNAHSRLVTGVVRRNTGILGMANGATTIIANGGIDSCKTHGPDKWASALNWARVNGANVINHSASTMTWNDPNPNAGDFLFDYQANSYPYPLIVTAAGNGAADYVGNKLRNGLVVGGGVETAGQDRSQVFWSTQWYSGTAFLNGTDGASGYELPHLTAISVDVTTAGYYETFTEVSGGTSMAAPEVAGIAASVLEANSSLIGWPEALVPGLMASADEDTDGAILNLHDGVDDRDGAGLVNGYQALVVLSAGSKVNGGNPPMRQGHDYGAILAAYTPAMTFYSEQYVARVPPGFPLRVAAMLAARPTCPQNPDSDDCSADPYPRFGLFVYDGSTPVGLSINPNSNYQYVSFVNTSGVQKDYTIKVYLVAWNGLPSTTWGMAWSTW